MSDQEGKKPKRSLKLIVSKGLMPEILPDPLQAKVTGSGPRDRVRKRLAQITERAAAIAAAASLSAGCSDSHTANMPSETDGGSGSSGTHSAGKGGRGGASGVGGFSGVGGTAGYGVVDPLPPPAGTGGFGGFAGTGIAGTGIAGSAGYGVVDPMPEPYACPASSQAELLVESVRWVGDAIVVQVQLTDAGLASRSFLQTAMVDSGLTATITGLGSVSINLSAQGGTWPPVIDLFLGFRCNAEDGVANYAFHIRLQPGVTHSGDVPFIVVTDDMDAGI